VMTVAITDNQPAKIETQAGDLSRSCPGSVPPQSGITGNDRQQPDWRKCLRGKRLTPNWRAGKRLKKLAAANPPLSASRSPIVATSLRFTPTHLTKGAAQPSLKRPCLGALTTEVGSSELARGQRGRPHPSQRYFKNSRRSKKLAPSTREGSGNRSVPSDPASNWYNKIGTPLYQFRVYRPNFRPPDRPARIVALSKTRGSPPRVRPKFPSALGKPTCPVPACRGSFVSLM